MTKPNQNLFLINVTNYSMKKYLAITIILSTMPAVVFAAPRDLTELMWLFVDLLNQAIVVVVALALLFFFWGLANFILYASDDKKREEGKNIMIWGIVALFVMISVWGIVAVLQNTFF